jgi:hypothetical protein
LQEKLKACRFLILDEKSMIGLGTMHRIDQRLRQVFPEAPSRPLFGPGNRISNNNLENNE